jgi:ubiquinone/menaquinone biosynthesis C-methylase UbiE
MKQKRRGGAAFPGGRIRLGLLSLVLAVTGGAVLVLGTAHAGAEGPAAGPSGSSGEEPAVVTAAPDAEPCHYITDILSVSLPGQAGQPEQIEVTGNDYATYLRNLGLKPGFGPALAGRRVLDVGAGLSNFVDIMAERHGAEALAIDVAYGELNLEGLSPECVELFHRRRIPMDARRILFPSNFFDVVVCHSLLKWFFLFEPEAGEDARLRIQRGMDILGQMVRVTNAGGEVRTTDFPDPDDPWYAAAHPELADEYRAAYHSFLRPYAGEEGSALEISFHYRDGEGYTVIQKLRRLPRVDASSSVSVVRLPQRRLPRAPEGP